MRLATLLQVNSYFCIMNWKNCLLLFVALSQTWLLNGQISGFVLDSEGEALPGAFVWLLPDSVAQVSDASGKFTFSGLKPGKYIIEVRFLGFEPCRKAIELEPGQGLPLNIRLEEAGITLTTMVVTEEHAKQERTLHADHFNREHFARNIQGSFAKSLERLPGIRSINVGVGIAKPVIRGLSSNRILVNQQGIKQESQQWGSDHGLEVDQFDVERIEIVKGPASLQYGSDGLGGVINIMPGRILPRNSFGGSMQTVYKTNNQHVAGSGQLAGNINDVFFSARYSHQRFGDYRVPADRFEYNSFTLPILDQYLKNTAGRERTATATVGIRRNWGVSRLIFSHYALEAGLFSGAVGIPRAYALTPDGNRRNIDIPKQAVDHYRISYHQTVYRGADHLDFNLGYQYNHRREFSYPEFHSIPDSQIDPGNNLALELGLRTWTANAHYEQHHSADWKTVYGLNAQWQENRRGGFVFLLPNFRTFRSGIFALAEKQQRKGWFLSGGLRLDYGSNETDFNRQWVWNSNEVIIDSLVVPATDQHFFNWSASLGSAWTLPDDHWSLKANLGKSFRVPYPSETVSNGIHHGTFRHEVGTPDLKSEHGYQLDLSADWKYEHFTGSVATFFNYFEHYIYLGPTFPARFSALPEAGQIFQYRQDDAIYTGFELQWSCSLPANFQLEQVADFVQSYNLNTRLALPFTPQPRVYTSLQYSLPEGSWYNEFFVEIGYEHVFEADGRWRIDRSERATPAYNLWNAGVGFQIPLKEYSLSFNLQVQNLFNVFYLNHLSRYRLINIPEQGRNLVLSLRIPFGGKLGKQQ